MEIERKKWWQEAKVVGPKGGLKKNEFNAALNKAANELGITGRLRVGLFQYIRSILKKVRPEEDAFERIYEFLKEFMRLRGGVMTLKENAFNYILCSDSLAEVLDSALYNMRVMKEKLGDEMFAVGRREIWHAQIAETEFRLICEGGSGAGAFSINFSIALNSRSNLLSGKLWNIGMDFEKGEDGEFIARIVTTGSNMKSNRQTGPEKMKKFEEFRPQLKTYSTPQRLLVFLCLYVAYDLGAEKIRALSTQGARDLSTLNRSKGGYNYTELFKRTGFQQMSDDGLWLEQDRLQETFYEMVNRGVGAYETDALDKIFETFNQLHTPGKDKEFPLTVCGDQSMEAIAEAMHWARLQHRGLESQSRFLGVVPAVASRRVGL